MKRHVPRGEHHRDPGHDLAIPFYQIEAIRFNDRFPVAPEVARAGSLVRVRSPMVLAFLHHISRIRKRRPHRARRIDVRIATRVIEVQVRVDHERYVGHTMAGRDDRVLEIRARDALVVQRTRVLESIDVVELRVLFVPRAGIDEHEPDVVLDQEAPHPERNPVAFVGRDLAFPERLRHDAEHRAAVELLAAGLEGMHSESAYAARLD